MVWKLLKRVFSPPREVRALSDVNPGKAVLRGTIRALGDTVRSPVKGLSCVAFYYRAFYKAQSRGRWVDRVIKEAEVYAPRFLIEMDGGIVTVVPRRTGSFTPEQHREVQRMGLQGLRITEQVIRPGDRVRIRGRVRSSGDAFEIEPVQIDMLGAEEESRGPAARPPTKKKRKKRQR